MGTVFHRHTRLQQSWAEDFPLASLGQMPHLDQGEGHVPKADLLVPPEPTVRSQKPGRERHNHGTIGAQEASRGMMQQTTNRLSDNALTPQSNAASGAPAMP